MATARRKTIPMDWQPHEPPLIVVGGSLVLDRWRTADGPALRRFDLDPDTARFFGYSVDQAAAMPDSHYDGDMRAQGNLRAWREGRELNRWRSGEVTDRRGGRLGRAPAVRRSRPRVSYNVTAELRGQGIAPRALSALLAWAATQIGLRRAHLSCHVDNAASQRVAEKCGFSYIGQDGDEYKFERELDLRGGPTRLPPRCTHSCSHLGG